MARKRSKANYFTKETEEYIVKYNNSTNFDYRNKIFKEHIYYPFYKLAENIIHTFKFYYTDVEKIEDLKLDVVTMLQSEKIDKFDPTNGAKAYSYFGTIVKRWLINYNNKNYKKLKQVGSFDDIEDSYETKSDLRSEDAISSLYIYIREMTDCETPHLTRVISVLKESFYKKYKILKEQDLIYNKPL